MFSTNEVFSKLAAERGYVHSKQTPSAADALSPSVMARLRHRRRSSIGETIKTNMPVKGGGNRTGSVTPSRTPGHTRRGSLVLQHMFGGEDSSTPGTPGGRPTTPPLEPSSTRKWKKVRKSFIRSKSTTEPSTPYTMSRSSTPPPAEEDKKRSPKTTPTRTPTGVNRLKSALGRGNKRSSMPLNSGGASNGATVKDILANTMKQKHSNDSWNFLAKQSAEEVKQAKFLKTYGPILNSFKEKVSNFEEGVALPLRTNDRMTMKDLVKAGDSKVVRKILEFANKREKIALVNEIDYKYATPLFTAALQGNYKMTKVLIEAKAKVNWINDRGGTPLQVAIEQRKTDLVKYLIDSGARPAHSILSDVVKKIGKSVKHDIAEMVEEVIKHPPELFFMPPLQKVVVRGDYKQITQMLQSYENAAQMKDVDKQGRTLLSFAAEKGHFLTCRFLVDLGMDVNLEDHDGKLALHYAMANNHSQVVQYLLRVGSSTATVDIPKLRFWAPTYVTQRVTSLIDRFDQKNGSIPTKQSNARDTMEGLSFNEIVAKSVNASAALDTGAKVKGVTELSKEERLRVFEEKRKAELLESNVDPMFSYPVIRDRRICFATARYPLSKIRAREHFQEFIRLVEKGNVEKITEILQSIKDDEELTHFVNQSDKFWSTPIFWAVWHDNHKTLELLLQYNAKVNWRNTKNESPLSLAVMRNNEEIVRILLDSEAILDTDELDTVRRRMGDKLKVKKSISNIITSAQKARAGALKQLGQGVKEVEVTLREMNYDDKRLQRVIAHAETLLRASCMKGNLEYVTKLLEIGISPNQEDVKKRTPLHWAVSINNYNVAHILCQYGAKAIDVEEVRLWATHNIDRRIDVLLRRVNKSGNLTKKPTMLSKKKILYDTMLNEKQQDGQLQSKLAKLSANSAEILHLRKWAEKFPFVARLNLHLRIALARRLVERKYAAGEHIVRQGDIGNEVFVITSGIVSIYVRGKDDKKMVRVNRIKEGDYFGELALLEQKPRTADVVADGPVTCYILTRTALTDVLEAKNLNRAALSLQIPIILKELEMVPLVGKLERGYKISLARKIREQTRQAGTLICKQGEVGDEMFIIRQGEAAVYVNNERMPNTLKKGDYFGEVALLKEGGLRTASIKALTNMTMFVLHRETFNQVIKQDKQQTLESEMLSELERVPMLARLKIKYRVGLSKLIETRFYEQGTKIVKQGAEGDEMFIIKSGSVSVLQDGQKVAHMSGGGFFGEVALTHKTKRNATVVADEALEVMVISRASFDKVLADEGEMTNEIKILLKELELVDFVKRMDQNYKIAFVKKLKQMSFQAGEVLVHEGERGDHMLIIRTGQCVAKRMNGQQRMILPGMHVGEALMVGAGVNDDTVTTLSPVNAFMISREDFQKMMHEQRRPESNLNERLVELEQVPFVAKLEQSYRVLLAKSLSDRSYPANSVLIKQGDDNGEEMFIIRSGTVAVEVEGKGVVREMKKGEYFGEVALLEGGRRTATVTSMTDVQVWIVTKSAFAKVMETSLEETRLNARIEELRNVSLFARMKTNYVQSIATKVKERRYKEGTVIVKQGEDGQKLYLVRSGKCGVAVDNKVIEGKLIEKGGYFGEVALLNHSKRTATVTALTDVSCFTLDRKAFNAAIAEEEQVVEVDQTPSALQIAEQQAEIEEKKLHARSVMTRRGSIGMRTQLINSKLDPDNNGVMRRGSISNYKEVVSSAQAVVDKAKSDLKAKQEEERIAKQTENERIINETARYYQEQRRGKAGKLKSPGKGKARLLVASPRQVTREGNKKKGRHSRQNSISSNRSGGRSRQNSVSSSYKFQKQLDRQSVLTGEESSLQLDPQKLLNPLVEGIPSPGFTNRLPDFQEKLSRYKVASESLKTEDSKKSPRHTSSRSGGRPSSRTGRMYEKVKEARSSQHLASPLTQSRSNAENVSPKIPPSPRVSRASMQSQNVLFEAAKTTPQPEPRTIHEDAGKDFAGESVNEASPTDKSAAVSEYVTELDVLRELEAENREKSSQQRRERVNEHRRMVAERRRLRIEEETALREEREQIDFERAMHQREQRERSMRERLKFINEVSQKERRREGGGSALFWLSGELRPLLVSSLVTYANIGPLTVNANDAEKLLDFLDSDEYEVDEDMIDIEDEEQDLLNESFDVQDAAVNRIKRYERTKRRGRQMMAA